MSRVRVLSVVAAMAASATVATLGLAPTSSALVPSLVVIPVVAVAQASAVTAPRWYPLWNSDNHRGPSSSWPTSWPRPEQVAPTAVGPLTGRIIVIDPGHNRGNFTHAREINRHYWVGLNKICNTTGTETRSGYLEATYTFDVAHRLARRLAAAGATVVLTRDDNSVDTFGPCIQARGLLGGQVGADITVSIHADGGPSGGRGAFVYTPARLPGYTSQAKADESRRLARRIMVGLAEQGLQGSNYLRPTVSSNHDQGTLNSSSIPAVIVETLNMANHDDAAIATSKSGRARVALGLFEGIRAFFVAQR